MSNKDKWVRRFSVDETARHKNGFTIYKITSVLFPISSPEAVTVVSVWHRYSAIQQLHRSMKRLHAGLHLRGTFPDIPRHSYFKRFQQQVIEERAKCIKTLLEFIAEHKLLFTSNDFVNFLQTGYPEPSSSTTSGTINLIRSSLHLPIEETPPLEYQTDDDDSRSPQHTARPQSVDETDFISQIPIYEPADVEMPTHALPKADSFDSINSLDSIGSDLYRELDKVDINKVVNKVDINKVQINQVDNNKLQINQVDNNKVNINKVQINQVDINKVQSDQVLPDLINFDVPSTSKFEDYHTMTDSETVSLSSYTNSTASVYKSVSSLSNVDSKTKTEDSYVFEAGYMLNLAARYEDMKEYHRAFECYKNGIERMLIGVQSDSDPQRRALIKEKTNKYLSYAEAIYKNHLADDEEDHISRCSPTPVHSGVPLSMVRRPYSDLASYRLVGVLKGDIMLVLHNTQQKCYAIKVIQKIPNNLTEFDEYFLQRTNETRQPILPTLIPYMVPLHAYIETKNLIFLILSYAPGEKILDYIKNYAKSVPNTPAREVNLENVFSEPKVQNSDKENDNIIEENLKMENIKTEILTLKTDLKTEFENLNTESEISIIDRIEQNIENIQNVENKNVSIDVDTMEISVNDLVINSQKLLLNVDKALSEVPKIGDVEKRRIDKDVKRNIDVKEMEDVKIEIVEARGAKNVDRRIDSPVFNRLSPLPKDVIPPSAVCRWGAEILTALESLHNCGVICRGLNPSNILLGDRGQIILTYFVTYQSREVFLSKLHYRQRQKIYHPHECERDNDMFVAPELHECIFAGEREEIGSDGGSERDRYSVEEYVCDFWSFGAVMYELICGVPLSYYHRTVFTSHTILQMPDGLPLEAQSLLTQLLTYDPSERLGSGKDGVGEIKSHPYFKHIDWREVYESWVMPD